MIANLKNRRSCGAHKIGVDRFLSLVSMRVGLGSCFMGKEREWRLKISNSFSRLFYWQAQVGTVAALRLVFFLPYTFAYIGLRIQAGLQTGQKHLRMIKIRHVGSGSE